MKRSGSSVQSFEFYENLVDKKLFINGIKHVGNLIKIEKSKVYRISSSRSSFIEPNQNSKRNNIPGRCVREANNFIPSKLYPNQVIHSISKHHSSQRSPSSLNEIPFKLIRVSTLYPTHFRYHARGTNSSKDQADWHSLLTFFAVFRRSEGIDRWPSWYSSVPRPL